MNDDLIPADELAQHIERHGNVPVKLRITDPETGDVLITLVRRGQLSITSHSAAGTEYGDLDRVCRIDITAVDNA